MYSGFDADDVEPLERGRFDGGVCPGGGNVGGKMIVGHKHTVASATSDTREEVVHVGRGLEPDGFTLRIASFGVLGVKSGSVGSRYSPLNRAMCSLGVHRS